MGKAQLLLKILNNYHTENESNKWQVYECYFLQRKSRSLRTVTGALLLAGNKKLHFNESNLECNFLEQIENAVAKVEMDCMYMCTLTAMPAEIIRSVCGVSFLIMHQINIRSRWFLNSTVLHLKQNESQEAHLLLASYLIAYMQTDPADTWNMTLLQIPLRYLKGL